MYTISMRKFLSKYYNMQVKDANNLTHDQVLELFGIEACLECDTTIENIKTGKVVLVEDSENYIFGYYNPLFDKENEECEEIFEHPIIAEFYKNIEKETGLKKVDIKDLKMYELEELLKKSKKNSDNLTKKSVIKELHKRKELENNTKEEKLAKVRKREYRKEII